MPAPIRTVRDPKLSAWQSAVNETLIRKHHHEHPASADEPVLTDALAGDPRALGTTAFALSLAEGSRGFVLRETHELEAAAAPLIDKLMKMKPGEAAEREMARQRAAAAGHAEPQAPAPGQQPAQEALEAAAVKVTATATDVDQEEVKKQAVLSAHFYDLAESARTGHLIHALALLFKTIFWWGIRKYSTGDLLGWITTVTQYIKTYAWGTRKPMYRDWKTDGGGNINYSVIPWRLPKNAKVGIVGDWGTGMPDAVALLRRVLEVHKVDAVLHLGDVYYSGTRTEFRNNLLKVYEKTCRDAGHAPPLYNIPGNHCYYSRGPGFYKTIDAMNGSHDRRQQASFFCLRTEDDGWQFLGMDTGINDRNPLKANPYPGVVPSEADWHLDKIANFKGSTVLLSHHQLFSTNSKVNPDAAEGQAAPANVNPTLMQQFGGALGKVVAWLWGHEHNLVIYDPVGTLPPGRLVGSSAYEETQLEDPYKQKFPSVKDNGVRLKQEKGYYWHGYAIATVGDALRLDYYQFPSSGTTEWSRYAAAKGVMIEREKYGFLYGETIPAAGRAIPAVEISPVTDADALPLPVTTIPGVPALPGDPAPA